MKKIIILIIMLILLIIPLFVFNDTKASKKEIVKENKLKKNNKYIVKSDNISELLVENINEEVKEKIIIIEQEVIEISKKNKFRYITKKYDNINEFIKSSEKEVEEIKYVCVKEEPNFKIVDGKKYYYEGETLVKGLKIINNKRYYFDFNTGELIRDNVKSVIDISSWQGDINFEKVMNTGLVDSVIVRIGYGTTDTDEPVLDSKFKRNINELKRLNIPFGVYLFGYAQNINASNKEINFIDNLFKKYNLSKDTYIWYDAELTTFNNFYYSKPIYNMVIDNFVFKLNEMGYKNVGLYSNLHMLTKGSLSYEKKYPIWVAQYHNKCEYDKEFKGWQYRSDGKIEGINGKVDMNIFY